VNDLDLIVFLQHGTAPFLTTHDLAISFDGNPRHRQFQLSDQIRERRRTRNFSTLTIHENMHKAI